MRVGHHDAPALDSGERGDIDALLDAPVFFELLHDLLRGENLDRDVHLAFLLDEIGIVVEFFQLHMSNTI